MGSVTRSPSDDRRLAQVVARCQELPAQELLEYIDESDAVRDVGSQDVNEYLREITGEDFTAKDFRTWAGTVLAMVALREIGASESQTQARKNVVRAIETVARSLGNTPRVCRQCYVHPGILAAYLDGTLPAAPARDTAAALSIRRGLSRDESAVLALLRRRMAAGDHRDSSMRNASRGGEPATVAVGPARRDLDTLARPFYCVTGRLTTRCVHPPPP